MTTKLFGDQGHAGRGPAVPARPGPLRRRPPPRRPAPAARGRAALARTPTRASSTSTSSDVLDVEGVLAVWTYDDLERPMAEPLPLLIPHPALTHGRTQYALAKDEVNYVGEAIAFVVAVDRYVAEDAVSRIRVDYEFLPARRRHRRRPRGATASSTTTCPATSAPGWSRRTATRGPRSPTAPHTLTLDLDIERSACTPMEGRGTVARWDPDTSRLTVWSSTQTSTGVRGCVAAKLGLDLGQGRRDHPRRRRRLRREDRPPVARGAAGPAGGDDAGPAGEVHRGPARALHLLGPRARRRCTTSRSASTTTAGVLGLNVRVLARPRRLHAVRPDRPDHHLDPAARPLQAGATTASSSSRSTPTP